MNRRHFLQSSLYSSLLYGAGGFPSLVEEAAAGFVPLQNKVLVNLFMSGGPDFRHLVVPAPVVINIGTTVGISTVNQTPTQTILVTGNSVGTMTTTRLPLEVKTGIIVLLVVGLTPIQA